MGDILKFTHMYELGLGESLCIGILPMTSSYFLRLCTHCL